MPTAKIKQKPLNNQRPLTILFVSWFLYSVGTLAWMAVNDPTPPHCFILENGSHSL